ncbi:hypothetical protein SAZ10_30010 [Mesorhizobium sp. BAC0120]|uniref:hypothetical protein n=1 Tax=Mesorhizobium sp. BAC0120 TaxID=3090670 RepID=UPI00298CBA57|nr:hypothetical protein [Mesorhizobium sp. BAC0120]MDW6026001.1 hypothetical protein [Mesorhizobium sp. BAC0120]
MRADEPMLINRNRSARLYLRGGLLQQDNPRPEIFFLTLPCIEDAQLPRFRHAGMEVLLMLERRIRFDLLLGLVASKRRLSAFSLSEPESCRSAIRPIKP